MPEAISKPPEPPSEAAILRRARLLEQALAEETQRDVLALGRRHAHLLKGPPHDPQ